MIDSRATNHAVDRIAVGQRARERFEEHHAHAFARHIAIRTTIECAATAMARHRVEPTKRLEVSIRETGLYAADNGVVALTTAQRLHGQMHCNQRTGASRVERDGRPFEIQDVRDAVAYNCRSNACGRVNIGAAIGGGHRRARGHCGNKHPGGAPRQGIACVARVFQGFPHHF